MFNDFNLLSAVFLLFLYGIFNPCPKSVAEVAEPCQVI